MPGTRAPDAPVAIGEITSPHGIRGLVRVRLHNPDSTLLAVGRVVTLAGPTGECRLRIDGVSRHGRGGWLVGFENVADRTAAEALVGHRILVAGSELPPLAPHEFYHHEVVGFVVETTDGRVLGTVTETMPTGLNDVWVVRDDGHEHLIPVVADVVETVDRTHGRIVIRPIDGLLE